MLPGHVRGSECSPSGAEGGWEWGKDQWKPLERSQEPSGWEEVEGSWVCVSHLLFCAFTP